MTVFDEWENRVYEGVPEMRGQVLYIADEWERHRIELSSIVQVECVYSEASNMCGRFSYASEFHELLSTWGLHKKKDELTVHPFKIS